MDYSSYFKDYTRSINNLLNEVDVDLISKSVELIKSTIRVANGRLTCAEALGHKEFVMTKLYRSA